MRTILLSQGKTAIVDDEDYGFLSQWKWNVWGGYACRIGRVMDGEKRKRVFMHRAILAPPDGTPVDHKNGDTLDNRRCNIRTCTPAENARNATCRRDNLSGLKGVHTHKKNGIIVGYVAQIKANKKCIYLGFFQDPDEAARAYSRAAEEHHGEFSVTRRNES